MANDLAVVTGLEEVCQMLDELPREIVARAWLKALSAGAKVIEEYLIGYTPEQDEGTHDESVPHLRDDTVIKITLDSGYRGGIALIGFRAKSLRLKTIHLRLTSSHRSWIE